MQIFLIILGTAVAIFVILVFIGTRLGVAAGKKAAIFFEQIDKKYEDLSKSYLAQKIIEEELEQIDKQVFAEMLMQTIRPEIDALISVINTTELSEVKIKYQSKSFQTALHKAEEMYNKRYMSKRHLNEKEKEEFYEIFYQCIQSDIATQFLKIKSGTF